MSVLLLGQVEARPQVHRRAMDHVGPAQLVGEASRGPMSSSTAASAIERTAKDPILSNDGYGQELHDVVLQTSIHARTAGGAGRRSRRRTSTSK